MRGLDSLALGLGIGSLRPVERVIAATQAAPAGDVLPAQTAQSGPRITTRERVTARLSTGEVLEDIDAGRRRE